MRLLSLPADDFVVAAAIVDEALDQQAKANKPADSPDSGRRRRTKRRR